MSRLRAASAAALLVLAGTGWATPASAAPQASTTTLVLSPAESVYGQPVTLSAHVDTDTGLGDGDVVFSIGNASLQANLTGGGSATIVLPRETAVGTYAVSARFVPRLPNSQATSTSAPASLVVSQVRTRLNVRVTGRGAHVPTSVVLGAAGDFGTLPTGAVTVTVRHLGTGKVIRRARSLDGAGAATARFGILRTGTYRLRVTYAGDSQHHAARQAEEFIVRQR
jgi:hypothetical protein